MNTFLGGATPDNVSFGALSDGSGAFAGRPTHLGVSTTTPAEDGTGFTEPSGSDGYARIALTLPGDFVSATDADPSVLANASSLTFNAATNNSWGSITHVGLFNASSSGDLLFFLVLDTPRTIDVGETLSFSAGNLQFQLD